LPIPRPKALSRQIESWFERNQRPLPWRETYDPWHVWVSEIMLQQTRMDVVLPYFHRFITRFPRVGDAAEAAESEVLALWSGLGYYRRATMLHRGAIAVVREFDETIPSRIDELLQIPGVGRYTAGAIASIAFGKSEPIVDGNVTRVLSRLFALEDPLGSAGLAREAWKHASQLVHAASAPRAFNQGLMELGALICTPRNPRCEGCPVARPCQARLTNRIPEFPRAKQRVETTRLRIALYIVADGQGRVLMRREQGRLMRAMYHLPHGDSSLLPGQAFPAAMGERVGSFRHTITTRRIEFTVYTASSRALADRDGSWEWVPISELSSVPHPSYVRKALDFWQAR
jgi:A/G-specific adenine glycosylase